MTNHILKFDGTEFAFLSNFYTSVITINGRDFQTVEHYYQAMKATNEKDFDLVASAVNAGAAKRLGRKIKMREDWEEVKEDVMFTALRAKFTLPEFKELLLATGDAYLVEGNTWGDCYWGVDFTMGKGLNRLGELLMDMRFELQVEDFNNHSVEDEIRWQNLAKRTEEENKI